MEFYAHTQGPEKKDWEPLFTPACPTLSGQLCEACQNLDPKHGHLNKVAHLAATFAAEMFPPGPNRESAKQWAHLAGLWHLTQPVILRHSCCEVPSCPRKSNT